MDQQSHQTPYDWENLWQAVQSEWQLKESNSFYLNYLKQTFVVGHQQKDDGFEVTLGITNPFLLDRIRNRFGDSFQITLSKLAGVPVQINYIVATKPEEIQKKSLETPLFDQLDQNVEKDIFVQELKRYRLEPERSLDNFAVSSSNEMAYAAAKAVSQRPGAAYNPLFLYGGVGVGKTHLMQGIGQVILKNDMSTKIIYCTGEEFTNAIIEAIRKKSTSNFRNKYRTVRLLMIDDIQFIAGKNSVQEEFFHTFNAVTAAGGQIIMTSDKPPKEIDSLEDRLRSRFEGGLTIDIGEPNFELRCAILMIKAEQLRIQVPTEVAQLIAQNEEDTRALVGKLVTISTMARDQNKVLTVDLARLFLSKLPNTKQSNEPPTPAKVIDFVAQYYQQPAPAIIGSSRVSTLTLPRHLAMYLINQDLEVNLKEVGRLFNGRDHTSVMHAVRKVTKLIKTDAQIRQDINQIKTDLHIVSGKVV